MFDMLDFPFEEPSVNTSIYCLIIYSLFVLYYYRSNRLNNYNDDFGFSVNKKIKWIVGFMIVTFCVQGDFFHYMDRVHNYDFTPGAFQTMEAIYRPIIQLVQRNYLLFRTIVWGGAYLLFIMTCDRFNVNRNNASYILVACFAVTFSYARVTMAMACYFYGLSFFCKPYKEKLLGYFFGAFMIYISFMFHASALFLIAMTMLLLIPLNRLTFSLLIISLPIIIYYAQSYFQLLLTDETILDDDLLNSKLESYSMKESIESSIRKIFMDGFNYARFYLGLFIGIIAFIINQKKWQYTTEIYRLFKIAIGIIVVSNLFLFFNLDNQVFFYRFLNMSMIPIIIIVTYIRKYRFEGENMLLWRLETFLLNLFILVGIAQNLIYIIYGIYLNNLSN